MSNILTEIKRLQESIAKTNSPYLKRDYQKRINKLSKQLKAK